MARSRDEQLKIERWREKNEEMKKLLKIPPIFYGLAKPEENGGFLSGKSFSLSRILIAVSLFVSIFWFGLIVYLWLKIFSVEPIVLFIIKNDLGARLAISVATVCAFFYLLLRCRSNLSPKKERRGEWKSFFKHEGKPDAP